MDSCKLPKTITHTKLQKIVYLRMGKEEEGRKKWGMVGGGRGGYLAEEEPVAPPVSVRSELWALPAILQHTQALQLSSNGTASFVPRSLAMCPTNISIKVGPTSLTSSCRYTGSGN